jgi:hypothetical protein
MLYVFMLKSISNVKFISSTRVKTRDAKKRDSYVYSINMNVMKYHSELLNYRAQNRDEYHEEALKIINIQEIDYFK